MRALLEAGIEIDVFPIYPLDSSLWGYSHDTSDDEVLPRDRIHHLSLSQCLKIPGPSQARKFGAYVRDIASTGTSAARYGVSALAKTAYVMPKAWTWAQQRRVDYDHVLAYWGNYSATCAYVFHRLVGRPIPFSIWLHAGADLYETPVYMRQKLLYADQIITCCAFNRTFLSGNYPDIFPAISEKINVCYHGVDFADFPYQPDGHQPNKIIAVGRFAKEKGFSYLLRAVQTLISRGVDVELEMVGEGEEGESLRSLAHKLHIADRVKFRGWLKFSAVQSAMQTATLLVHPSDGLGDGLPNVIREAMALGTPVIASRVAGIHEALDDGCGRLVPPRNVSVLASSIEELLSDPQLRRSFADAARKRAEEKFDMWRNGQDLAQILRATKRAELGAGKLSTKDIRRNERQPHPQEIG